MVMKQGLIYTSPVYLYVIKSGADAGGLYISNSDEETGYIALDNRFTMRTDEVTQSPYLEYNPSPNPLPKLPKENKGDDKND
jgi:hypothetical protein